MGVYRLEHTDTDETAQKREKTMGIEEPADAAELEKKVKTQEEIINLIEEICVIESQIDSILEDDAENQDLYNEAYDYQVIRLRLNKRLDNPRTFKGPMAIGHCPY